MLFVFLSDLSFMSYFLSMFLINKGMTLSITSVCFLIYQLSKFAFEIPTGFVADKYSRKLSGIIGLVLLIMSYTLLMADYIIVFFISFFLRGLGITFISGSLESLFVDSVDHDSLIKYNVIERLVFYVALAMSAGFGGVLINYCGYKYTIIVDICMVVLTLILVCNIDEKKENSYENGEKDRFNIKSVFKEILQNKVVCIMLFIDFANAFAFVAVEDFYSAFLSDLGVESEWVGLVMAAQFVISALFGLFTTKIANYFEPNKILYIAPALRALISISMYVGQLPIILIPLVFLIQLILFAIYAPIKYQLFQKSIRPTIRSTVLSLQSLSISMGAIMFYCMSSILGRILSIGNIMRIALICTAVMLIRASFLLKKQKIKI